MSDFSETALFRKPCHHINKIEKLKIADHDTQKFFRQFLRDLRQLSLKIQLYFQPYS